MEAMVLLRDEFLMVVAHELRTPLTSLLGNIQLIHRRAQQEDILSERDQRNLRVVVDQASRLNRLVLTLLDLSRLHMGDLSMTRSSFDLVALVQQVVEATRPTLNRHTLTYTGPSAPVLIEGDPLRLEEVLHNLVQNAVKYSPAGGPVQIQLAQRDSRVSLAVADQGLGIPQAAQPQLFQRFYRAPNVSGSNINGLGIGLYVVKEIITLHDGTIEVVSEEGRGSTFTIWLPLPDHAHANARPSQSTAPSPGETA
jgi:signal transduction histidine kinase